MRFSRVAAPVLCVALAAFSAQAASTEDLRRLSDAMRTDEMIGIIREEGLTESEEIGKESFPGRVPASWNDRMARIYDAKRLSAVFEDIFFEGIGEADITPLIEFFESDLGQEIIELEISGRRAFISEDVEQAAREAWASNDDDTREDQLRRFIEANDLLERNVSGALNSTLAFYQGLSQAEAFAMSEEQMLRDVWVQEPEIRTDTRGWLYAYLGMSYEPLSDEDLETYITLSETDAGQALNTALFEAFDQVFDDVSYRVGEAIAQLTGGEEL